MSKSGTPFFLSGGTALSRFYFDARYSDDLDLFLINNSKYSIHVNTLLSHWIESENEMSCSIDKTSIKRGQDYTQVYFVHKDDPSTELRVDLINDIAPHYGQFEYDPVLGKVDSWRNILSNKLTTLFRSEPKDVVDLYTIANNMEFNWKVIVADAKSKEIGIEPEIIHDILKSFPVDLVNTIKWNKKPDQDLFAKLIAQMAEDILFGRDNSLVMRDA